VDYIFFNITLRSFENLQEGKNMIGFAYPDISPIIFSLGPVAIRWYSMAYLVGIIAAWLLVSRDVKKYDLGLTKENMEDAAFYVTLGIILGGRVGYMLVYGRDMLFQSPLSIFEIWKGGMSFHGGIIGVIIALWLLSRKLKYEFLRLTDMICVYVPIGIFLGRLANFANDELWGRETSVPWAVRFPSGGYLPRHPSQLYEALTEGLLMFAILLFCWRCQKIREKTGFVSGLFLFLYGFFRMSMEHFRQPDVQMGFFFKYITMGQMLSLPFLILGLCLIVRAIRLSK